MIHPIITDESVQESINYLGPSLQLLLDNGSAGYVGAFVTQSLNEQGLPLRLDDFQKLLRSLKIDLLERHIPNEFILTIKYSPIAGFKKWIFTISNQGFVKVLDRSRAFHREFFLFLHAKTPIFHSIVTNVAHEKFLLGLYERTYPDDQFTVEFNTFVRPDHRLVLYRHYLRDKTSAVTVDSKLEPFKLYPVRIDVHRESRLIRYRVKMGDGPQLTHQVRLGSQRTGETASRHPPRSFKSIEDYREEVYNLIKTYHGVVRTTNKFANIALGRVNKIPVLVNLATKFHDRPVKLVVSRNRELLVYDAANDLLIKTFTIARTPKSNWLEKK